MGHMAKGDRKRLVILDTHAILHRAYHALPEFSSSKGEPTGGLYGLLSMLVKIINDLGPEYIVAAVDLPGGTFRSAAYQDYKGTRVEIDEALLAQIKQTPGVLQAFGVPVYSAPDFEADDVIGTIVENAKKQKDLDIIVATGDKDALQLIDGTHVQVFTLGKGLNDTIMYDEAKVVERYGFGPKAIPDLKGIAGDPSDNIKGVPGVGEGSALKLLQKYGSIPDIFKAIKKSGVEAVAAETSVQKRFVELVKNNKEAADFSKMLATIRRDAPVDFTLPKQSWRDGADAKRALDMLSEFEFRGLVPRVKKILGVTAEAEVAEPGSGLFAQQVPQEELDKAALALWVLDSNVTNPGLEDILRAGKSNDFAEAFKNIREQLKEKELDFVYDKIELPLVPVLRAMESRGVKIDKKFLQQLSKEYHRELEEIAERVYKAAGGEFNISSPKQLGEILFDKLGLEMKKQKKTATGQRSTRESELEKLRDQHEIIGDILAYREHSKLLSTYIDAIPVLLDKSDRLHTHFIQTGTSTGRLGSENPNVQNIPIKTDLGRAIRHAFVADEGYQLLALDYSQIELRIAALMTGDEGLIDIFKNGRDAHTEVASRVFHVKPEEVTRDHRRVAKVINFGILYGMGVGSLQQSLETTRAEAQEFYNQYFEAFPRLADYMEDTKASAARLGYTQTFFGRRRYFDGIKSPIPYVKAAAERMAINAPIQGTSADLIKLAMVEIDAYFKKDGVGEDAYMLLQVHDELVFEVKESLVPTLGKEIKRIMETVIPPQDAKGIPFLAEAKVGKNWGEMEKLDA
jgi:DNA polymerase I